MSWIINSNSKTSITEYFNASLMDLSLVINALFNSITSNPLLTPNLGPITVSPTTTGSGSGVQLGLTNAATPGPITTVTVTNAGTQYKPGDSLIVTQAALLAAGWATASSDLIIRLVEDDFVNNTITLVPAAPQTTLFVNVSGYTSGTISFTSSAPSAWVSGTLTISVMGGMDDTFPALFQIAAPTNIFTVSTYPIDFDAANNNTTFYIDWNIPIQYVALSLDNNTGVEISVSSIRMQTNSEGSGLGYSSSSGSSTGPGLPLTSMQFNDGGTFGGASGALYDKNANTNTGQIQLANGTVSAPMLAFSSGTHPAGTYNTGIYRPAANQLGMSAGGTLQCGISSSHVSAHGGTAATPSYNFGVTGTDTNTGMYRPAADAIGFSTGGVEKASIYAADSGDFIEGLNVGLTGDIAGIQRLSATAENSWEDGNCGNSEFIVFTASDFMSNAHAGRDAGLFIALSSVGAGAIDSPVVNNNGPSAGAALAIKLIPKGFIIDENATCNIYSDIRTVGSTPQQMTIDVNVQIAAGPTINVPISIVTATIISQGPFPAGGWAISGNGSVNRTPLSISLGGGAAAAATGTGYNTVNVLVTPASPMNSTFGGIVAFKVPIKRI